MTDFDLDDVMVRTFLLFVQTARGVLKYTDAHLYREAHRSIVQLVVLHTLASNGGVITPSEIAECTGTERHNITGLVQRMKQYGLITTEPNRGDRRVVNVIITSKGREVLSEGLPVVKEVVEQTMLSISECDATLLAKLLGVLRQNAQSGLERLKKPASHGSE